MTATDTQMNTPITQANSTQPDEQQLFRIQFRKTRVCTFFQQGRCRHGQDCAFAHGAVDDAPDLTKTSICKQWKQGKCQFSNAECCFAHGKNDLCFTPLFNNVRRTKTQGKKQVHDPQLAFIEPSSDLEDIKRSCHSAIVRSEMDNLKAVLASEQAPAGLQMPMPKFGMHSKASRQVTGSAGIILAPLPPASQSEYPARLPLRPGLVSPIFQKTKKVKEFADIDPSKPMKIVPSFFIGSFAVDSPVSPTMDQASSDFDRTWEFWDGDTVAGETSSDDDGIPSPHASIASMDDLPPYSSLMGVPAYINGFNQQGSPWSVQSSMDLPAYVKV